MSLGMTASASTTTIPANPQTASQHTQASTSSSLAETLTLKLVPRRRKKGVKWTEETVDNEFAGKKSSKKCCIFHRRRQFGDWSDSDDSGAEDGAAGCSTAEPQPTATECEELQPLAAAAAEGQEQPAALQEPPLDGGPPPGALAWDKHLPPDEGQ